MTHRRPTFAETLVSALTLAVALAFAGPLAAQDLPSVFLEELTWTEVRDAIDGGTTTIIIPTAGTEQNGPHMVLGKHKFIVNYASARIARELGNALVAPVPNVTVDPAATLRSSPLPELTSF